MRTEIAESPASPRALAGPRAIPNFLVIGAMKAGTTSLFHYLNAHPEVYMSPLKELDFFVEDGNWRRGTRWYAKQFKAAGDSLAVGEASTAYSKYPTVTGVPERIARLLPNVRLIYLLRDPIDRTVSHYRHRVAIGAERQSFEDAIHNDPVYIRFSRYAMQLDQYLVHFDPDQILIITSEELRTARAQTMRQVYSFLEVDAGWTSSILEREFYESSGRAAYPPAVWWMRRRMKRLIPASKRMKEFFDATLPHHIKPLSRPGGTEFHLDASQRVQLADVFRDDVERLRKHMPAGWDGWGIA